MLHLLSCTAAAPLLAPFPSLAASADANPAPLLSADDATGFYRTLPCPASSPSCRPVEVLDFRIGSGLAAGPGATLLLRWTGRLADRYGWPIQKEDADEVELVLGDGELIQGFEIGVTGMREGGKRRLVIPAEMGYLDEKKGPLPQRFGDRRRLFATVLNERRFKKAGDLVIDVQLRKVRPPKPRLRPRSWGAWDRAEVLDTALERR